ncbi:MAG: DUF3108 domain-containing protein [Alphaproteobacteria bacterium]
MLRLATCAALGAWLIGPGTALAAERQLTLDYRVYVGGFPTADIVYDTRVKPDGYTMKLRLDARGIIEWLFTWNMTAESEGRLVDGRVVPVRAISRSNWRGRERRIDLDFPKGGGAPISSVDPIPHDDDRDPVPAALRLGTVDLAAAIVATVRAIGATGRCDNTARVFDGRRRYDLVFSHVGEGRVRATDYSAYSGPALRCGLRLVRIAGFRKKRSRLRWANTDTAILWLARVFPGTSPVLVRMELETKFGALVGHIVAATLSGDGATRRIARPD